MSKPITVILVENNLLDRAVLDLYVTQQHNELEFQLRYSRQGQPIQNEDDLHAFLNDLENEDVILLFDLGLSPDSEHLMPDEKVQAKLRSNAAIQYLAVTSRAFPRSERFPNMKEHEPELFNYVTRIEGLSALYKIRLQKPMLLCGIVSHFVYSTRIQKALTYLLLNNSALDPEEYQAGGDYADIPLVIYKGQLDGLMTRLQKSWQKWRIATDEYYCKAIVEAALVEDQNGTVTSVKEWSEKIKLKRRDLVPKDRVSPIFIADFLGLHEGGVQYTFRRLLRPLFKDIEILRASDVDLMREDCEYLLAPNDDVLRHLPFDDAVDRVCSSYRAHRSKQLICILSGDIGAEASAFDVLTGQRVPGKYCYRMLSLARIFQDHTFPRERQFDQFIRVLVESARDRSTYMDGLEPEPDEASLDNMRAWVKKLHPTHHIPADVFTFVDWLREALCKGFRTEQDLRHYLKQKTDEELKQSGRKRRGEK
jgi:hypothetical protein